MKILKDTVQNFMRKFLIISLMLTVSIKASSCASEGPTHNAYMFSVFHREMMGYIFSKKINSIWKDYCHQKIEDYDIYDLNNISPDKFEISNNKIIQYTRSHGDREMLAYLRLLTNYLNVCDAMNNPWNYPSKREILILKGRLMNINQQARLYRGTRLYSRHALLVMRTYFTLKNYKTCSIYWNTKARMLTNSVFKDMMKDIYAGTLVQTGNYEEACNIYAELNDMRSIKWCMRKQRNLNGIEKMYSSNANSPVLPYLVQDFVNNAQETIDDNEKGDKDWFKIIDVNPIYKNEVMHFIKFANSVVSEDKTKVPILWQTASAFLNYLFGYQDEALRQIETAQTMRGSKRMKDNARAIKLLISIKSAEYTPQYSDYLFTEMNWLEQKVKEDTVYDNSRFDSHYNDVIERLVYNNLVPKYLSWGKKNVALALIGMAENRYYKFLNNKDSSYQWNYQYTGDYFGQMDTMKVTSLVDFYKYIRNGSSDKFEQWIINGLNLDDDYFNDLIGTKYIRICKFKIAAEYLKKVPLNFLRTQNIAEYMLARKYTTERWMKHQKMDFVDGPSKTTFTYNPKLKFCQEMNDMENAYTYISNKEERQQNAYNMAVRYYQASYMGDCWFITRYKHSIIDSTRENETDFISKAVNYLNVSKLSSNFTLTEKSLYALAYIPLEPWGGYFDLYESKYHTEKINTTARQYHSMIELALFCKNNNVDGFVSKCDVLKQFLSLAKK
jgi:hypothetical protein